MPERIFRIVLLVISLYILISDLQEISNLISVRRSTPVFQHQSLQEESTTASSSASSTGQELERQHGNLHKSESKARLLFELIKTKVLAILTGISGIGNTAEGEEGGGGNGRSSTNTRGSTVMSSNNVFNKELIRFRPKDLDGAVKSDWIDIMKNHCLPKLICELYANLNEFNTLSDMEINLLKIMKETSLSTAGTGTTVSTYHFAAHIGQLLNSIDGNGCYNFYTKCPISRFNVLKLIKNVKIK